MNISERLNRYRDAVLYADWSAGSPSATTEVVRDANNKAEAIRSEIEEAWERMKLDLEAAIAKAEGRQ